MHRRIRLRRIALSAVGMQLDAQLTRFAEYGFSGSVLVGARGPGGSREGYGMADGSAPSRIAPQRVSR